jgi:hypothetical protein
MVTPENLVLSVADAPNPLAASKSGMSQLFGST